MICTVNDSAYYNYVICGLQLMTALLILVKMVAHVALPTQDMFAHVQQALSELTVKAVSDHNKQ